MTTATPTANCPRCGSEVPSLVSVDAGMKLILQNNLGGEVPAAVCANCFSELTNSVSQGVKLRIEQAARAKNRHMLWKSRVSLVKHARQMMAQKNYSDAAVSYEKYLRVLEISFEKKSGELSPDVFGKSARSKELTVIATCYWDLMRIYDTNPQYRDRMSRAARKLAEFIPYSTIFPDVAKKAQIFSGSARNPDVVREFLRISKAGTARCFIATAAFEDENHDVVLALRTFRDEHLYHSRLGFRFVQFYYRHSPPIAQWLESRARMKSITRGFLRILSKTLS